MTPRLGRRSGAVVALTALFALLPAAPAGAEPRITVNQPKDGQVFDSESVTVDGTVTENGLSRITRVTLSVGDKTFEPPCNSSPCTFSWPVTLPVNGTYDLKVVATDSLLGATGATATESRTFAVAAPPRRPALDPPKVNDDRSVTLTWSRNTEPDMLRYTVSRKAPGAGGFSPLTTVTQPASGNSVSFTDATTSGFDGGAFAYQVVAVRKAAGGTVPSEASSTGTATVPAPPTTTTAAPPPGSPAAGPGTTAKPGPPAGVDLSGYLSSRSQPISLPPITVPELPDSGFGGTLPFGARPPGDDIEPGDAAAVAPSGSRSTSIVSGGAGRPLVPIAAGLILLMLAMHVRLLNRRIKQAPGGDLPVDLHVAPAAAEPAAEPERKRTAPAEPRARRRRQALPPPSQEPAPRPPDPAPVPVAAPAQFYDILQEADWAPTPEGDVEPGPELQPAELWAAPASPFPVARSGPEAGYEPDPEPDSYRLEAVPAPEAYEPEEYGSEGYEPAPAPEGVEPRSETFAPEAFEPEVFEPEVFEPEAFQAEAVEPDVYESETFEPEPESELLLEPAAYEPAAYEPAAYEPAAYEPAAYEPAAYEPVSSPDAALEPDFYGPHASSETDPYRPGPSMATEVYELETYDPEPAIPPPAYEAEADAGDSEEIEEIEEIEVFDVVTPTRRRLARSGSR